ncbi:hypothetical protein OIU84_028722 [Salix udensis]|uniref:Wall-associated receptor kinase galacturonan-binding domain-containing protein n=1 Tax=Salix udensis TaxID=889485 RepID=A0AAD6KD86_9ROSI|nr:hypothetical protein OIU84_028722 [Salix udensis]
MSEAEVLGFALSCWTEVEESNLKNITGYVQLLAKCRALILGSSYFHAPSSAFADDDLLYLSCMKSFDCGNIRGAGYPFSGSDWLDYCGYPGFELSCRNQDRLANYLESITSCGLTMFPEQITQNI